MTDRRSRTRSARTARCPSSSSPRVEERPTQVCDDCGEVEAWSPDGNQILYRRCRAIRRASDSLTIGASHESRLVEESGLRDLQSAPLVGRQLDRFQRQAKQAGARAGHRRQGAGAGSRRRERTGSWSAKDGDAPKLVAGRESPVLLVGSRRLSVPVGATSRSRRRSDRPGRRSSIQHFHRRGLSWRNLYLGAPDIAVARDKVVFNLGEHTGNIWLTQPSKTPE